MDTDNPVVHASNAVQNPHVKHASRGTFALEKKMFSNVPDGYLLAIFTK